jgi:hypothetical protein
VYVLAQIRHFFLQKNDIYLIVRFTHHAVLTLRDIVAVVSVVVVPTSRMLTVRVVNFVPAPVSAIPHMRSLVRASQDPVVPVSSAEPLTVAKHS